MKKYLIAVCLAYFFLNSCYVPKYVSNQDSDKQYIEKYKPYLDEGSVIIRAWYHYSVEKTKDNHFVYKRFYPSTNQITHYETYLDEKLTKKEGLNKEWLDNGNLLFEGNYKANEKFGEWKRYAMITGRLQEYGNYQNGKKEGQWTMVDSTGNTMAEYQYLKNEKNGPFKEFDTSGQIETSGKYINGERVVDKGSKEKPAKSDFTIVEVMPYIKSCKNEDLKIQKECSDKKMLTSLYSQIKYPAFAREMGIDGSALCGFNINKDGNMTDFVIHRGVCDQIKDECLRVIKLLPQFNPGLQRGKPVKVRYTLPIKFRLE